MDSASVVKNPTNPWAWGALGVDVVCLFTPATGLGRLVKIAEIANEEKKIIKAEKQLISKGTVKSKPQQVHHFATNKSKTYTPQIEKITSKYDLDLDETWNKKLMPHQGRHPNEYHEYVLENLKQFDSIAKGDKTKFLKLFDKMKQEIINNPEMLYKNYWKNK